MANPRFTLQLTLKDNSGFDRPLSMAVGCDEALRVSARSVDELKMGVFLAQWHEAVTMLKIKELRRHIFLDAAQRLAHLMADRMEDAEGWHDPDRIEPARRELGGTKW